MALTLYRKYRPKTFKELVGQNHIKITIQSELESGKIAHAYLFSGPRGLGKTTTARLLAKALNCLKTKPGQSEPCNSCDSCTEIMENKSLDVIEIDAASHTGVDNVRENIINHSRFTPTSRKFKVFIIDEVHMLSISAFNALLKTLEEPPTHTIFVLATTEIHKVPETIVSRCQHFEFRKVSQAEVVKRLSDIASQEGKKIDKSVLENIAYYGGGSIRDAESLLGQLLSLDDKEITAEQAELVLPRSRFDSVLEFIGYLLRNETGAALTLINDLVEEGVDLEKFTDDLIEALRKILLIKVSPKLGEFAGNLTKDTEKQVIEIAGFASLGFLVKSIEIFIAKRQELKFSDISQLPLELAVVQITSEDKNDGDHNDSSSLVIKKAVRKETPKPEPSPPVKATPKQAASTSLKISLDHIKSKWQEVLMALKKHNQSLASTLKIGRPSGLDENGNIEIQFRHEFHRQRVNDVKNRKVLEDVLKDIFGLDLSIKTVIVKDLDKENSAVEVITEKSEEDDQVNDILKTFGGQVID